MNLRWSGLLVILACIALFALTACDTVLPPGNSSAPTVPLSLPPATLVPTAPPAGATRPPAAVAATATLPATASRLPSPGMKPTSAPPPPATGPAPVGSLACPPASNPSTSVPLAARVNGGGITMERYNREVALAQAAVPGTDPRSAAGQETIKGIRQQVLEQLIDELVISQEAARSGIKLTDAQVNAELAEMARAAGGLAGLNQYMVNSGLTMSDMCNEVRATFYGGAMLERVTAGLPTQDSQVHLRQIILASAAQAQTVRDQLRRGGDFAALAAQYSVDPGTRSKGGDLGWLPKGILDPQLDAVAFNLQPGQVSDVITTRFGFTIIQVTEKDASHPLSPEMLQAKKQDLYLTWLKAVRSNVKIERFAVP